MKTAPEIRLRPLVSSDFDTYFNMKSDPDDVRMSGHISPPERSNLQKWIVDETSKHETHLLVAVEATAKAIVGYVFIRRSQESEDEVEISYGVASDFRGKRMGQRMVREAANFARSQMHGIRYAVCWVATTNCASIKNVIAAGYQDSGKQKEQEFKLPKIQLQTMRKYVLAIETLR